MNPVRQLGSGLFYAVVSVVLVVGGLSLALAEGAINAPPPTARPSPTLFIPSPTAPQAATTTPLAAASSTPEVIAASSTAQFLVITATRPAVVVSPTSTRRLLPTSTRPNYATTVSCGPYSGWIKNYRVQTGDTLFHIATLYRTTVNALQVANCKQTTLIVPGELLWVPNVPTVTPGVTIIPTFTTPTSTPTLPLTATELPTATETVVPTDTSNPSP